VTGTLHPKIVGRTPGRALYVGRRGELYVSRRYAIYRSEDRGGTWQLDCFVPNSGYQPWVTRLRLGARLLRYYIAAFEVLADGTRIAVARDGIYRAAPGEARMTCSFKVTRGSRPLNLAVDGMRVLFGEYGWNLEPYEAKIYVSEDGGRTFEVGYAFPKGDVRHVHSVIVDPYHEGYWVFVGDFGSQPGIGSLSKDLRALEWLGRGKQKLRAVRAIVERDCLIYGMDSDCERNFIVSLDKQSGKISDLAEVDGSSLYAATFGPIRIISTGVEPNPACPSRECALYASKNGEAWQRFGVHKKDRYHWMLFQMGTLVLPYSYSPDRFGIFSGQAVESLDDQVSLLDLS